MNLHYKLIAPTVGKPTIYNTYLLWERSSDRRLFGMAFDRPKYYPFDRPFIENCLESGEYSFLPLHKALEFCPNHALSPMDIAKIKYCEGVI